MFFPKKKKMQKFPFFFVFRSKIGWKMKNNLKKLALKKNWYLFFEIFFCQNILSGRYVLFLVQLGAPKALKAFKKAKIENFLRRSLRERNSGIFPPGLRTGGSACTHRMLPFIVFCNLLLSLGSRKIILKNGGRQN
jgi:hypothetical protein